MAEDRDHLPFAALETEDKVSRNSTVTSENPRSLMLVRRQPLCVLLISTLLLCTACVILSSILALRWKCSSPSRTYIPNTQEYTQSNICSSKECLSESVNILRTLKQDIDPCEDFASFACDGGTPEYQQKQDLMLAKLRDLIERTKVPDRENSAIRKWKDYYTSCLYGLNEERENQAVRRSLLQLGGWANTSKIDGTANLDSWDLTGALITLRKSLGMTGHVFFDHCCGLDGKEITISGYWKGHFCDVHQVSVKRAYLKTIARLIGYADFDTYAEGVLTVDDEILCQGATEADTWSTMTMSQLNEIFPSIDWRRYIREVHNVARMDDFTIRIWHRSHFRRLSKEMSRLLQRRATKRQLRDYLIFGFIENNLNILPRSYAQAEETYLREIKSPNAAMLDNERWSKRSRWRWCLHGGLYQDNSGGYSRYVNNLSPITAAMMVKTSPQHLVNINSAAEMMREYWSKMREDLVSRISRSHKLDSNAKLSIQTAIQNINLHVGLPSWITDEEELDQAYTQLRITADSSSFYDNAVAVMRFDHGIEARTLHASLAANLLSTHGSTDGEYQADMGYGALLEFYTQKAMKSTLLGSLGVRLGDLITFPLRLGSEASNHLPESDRGSWEQCIVSTLNEAVRPEWNKHFPDKFDLSQSRGSSQSRARVDYFSQTLMGVQSALRLYKNLLREEPNGSGRRLPGLPYSANQIFFITTAQMGCFGQPSNDTLTDNYLFTKVRTNALMSTLPEFEEAFQCGPDSAMTRKTKCPSWPY